MPGLFLSLYINLRFIFKTTLTVSVLLSSHFTDKETEAHFPKKYPRAGRRLTGGATTYECAGKWGWSTAGTLTRSSTVAGPRDRSRRVPRPVPSWGPEPGRPPAERTLIMSVGARGGVKVGKAQFQPVLGRNPGILDLDTPLHLF